MKKFNLKKILPFITFVILLNNSNYAQTYNIGTANNTTISTCGGTFVDSGGSSGYSNNENYTVTFCSSSGLPLSFDFTTFDIDTPGDQLFFYDGTTATGTPIAVLDWQDDSTQMGGSSSQLQISTKSTCVTVKWISNSTGSDGGWEATVSCLSAPSCAGNPGASDIFGQATPICNLDNYCGNLSAYYGEDTPYNLKGGGDCPNTTDGIFGGTIENNSWLSFQANSTSATFNFDVPCGSNGIQVGIFGFDGTNFSLKSPCATTDGSQKGNFSVTANNLTSCQTYYIMIDGTAGALCDYTITANSGVAVANAGTDKTICGTSTNLSANTTTCTTGSWSVVSGTGTFSDASSPTATVSGLSSGTNVLRWSLSGFCNSTDDVSITVTPGTPTVIGYPTNSTTLATTAAAKNVDLISGPAPNAGSYTATPAGLTITNNGLITPSSSTAGTYTVTATTACGTTTATVIITGPTCGTCTLPDCTIYHNTTATSASGVTSFPNCTTLSPFMTSGSYQTCYEVTTNANGDLGFRISEDIRQNPALSSDSSKQCTSTKADAVDATRTYTLIEKSLGCPGSAIAPNATNVSGSLTGFNPEWHGLKPNTTYTLCVSVSVPDNSCQIEKLCMVYYHPAVTGCTTCATATCTPTSITATTAALGQTGITSALATAGNVLNKTLIKNQSTTVCVPVTVPAGSTRLGFKQNAQISSDCNTSITYQLRPASNCSATAIAPVVLNAASVSSGFNPEWNVVTTTPTAGQINPGNYILCYTVNVTGAACDGATDAFGTEKSYDLSGLGYYNVIAASTCEDYVIQLYSDELTTKSSQTTFTCTDPPYYLGPASFPATNFDKTMPYPGLLITVTATSGTITKAEVVRYNSANVAVENFLGVTANPSTSTTNGVVKNFFISKNGEYYAIRNTDGSPGTYTYTIKDAITGATLASGTWTVPANGISGKSILCIPSGTALYSGPGVTEGFDATGPDDYTGDKGIGMFNPQTAGLGTHTITYSWNNGLTGADNCTITKTKTVTVTGTQAAPTITGATICSGTTTSLTASGGTGNTFKWYNAATAGTLLYTGNPFTTPTLTANTDYWVSQTSVACGESARVKVTVTVTPSVAPTYTKASTNSTSCTTPNGTVTFTGVSAGATFSWKTGPAGYTFATPTTANLTGLGAGTYCVDITSPTVNGGTVASNLFADDFESGTTKWTIDNATGPNQFVVNNTYTGGTCMTALGAFTVATIPNQPAGTTAGPTSKYLHIKATTTGSVSCGPGSTTPFPPLNANFDGAVSDQKVTMLNSISTVGKTNVTFNCFWLAKGDTSGNDYGQIEYSTDGVTWVTLSPKLYGQTNWQTGSYTNAALNNQATLKFRIRWRNNDSSTPDPPLAIDQISITADTVASASCGTTVQECFTITAPGTPTITGTLSACISGTSQLTGSATAHASTAWTSSNTAVATISSVGLVTAVSAGTTTITYKNNNDCTQTATFTVNPNPTITGTLSACIGGTSQLTGSATAHATTAWTSSNTAVATISSTGLVTGVSAGTTTITYKNTNDCTQTATFTVNPNPTITGTLNACIAATSQLTGSATAHATTAWTSSNAAVATISNSGLVTAVSTGTTTITYKNTNGCTQTATFTVNPNPTITGTLSACIAGTSQLTGSVTAHATTAWTSSNTAVATISNTGLVTAVSAGTTTITYKNTNGCTQTATFTVNPNPTITGTLNACIAGTSQLTGSATAHATTAWTSSNTAVATISNTGLVTAVSAGTTTITYKNTNGCTQTATFTVYPNPTITGTLNACIAGTSQLTGSATAHATTAWTSSNTAVATISSTGLVTGVSGGTTTITYKNTNGCTQTATFTVNPNPTITGTLSACIAGTSQLTGSATAHATTAWTSSNTAVATISNTGLVTGVSAGTTTITYKNTNDCTQTATFTVNPNPTITGTLSACIAGTSQLTGSATAHATTAWTSSNTAVATISSTGLVTGVSVGTTNITYKNTNGCTQTATFTVNPNPTITGTVNACIAGTSQLTGSATAHATAPWTSSNTAVATISNTGLVTGVSSGTTIITYKNTNGCTQTATFTVNPNPTITGTLSACVAGTAQLTGSATANTTSPWTSSNTAVATISNTGLVTGVSAGTSTITYKNTNSCTQTATFTVNPLPTITGIVTTCSVDLATYDIDFVSTGTVTSTAGTVTGSKVTGITTGIGVTLTATLNGCTTTLVVAAPNCNCPTIIPPVGTDKTICSTATIPTLTVTVGTGETANWYTSGGTLLASATLSYTPTVKSTLTYYVETENTTTRCKSNTKTPIKLTVDTPAIVNAGLDTSVCAGSSVTLSGASTTNATTLSWSAPAGKGTFTNVNTLTPTFTPDASITSGTIELTLTAQSGNACADVIDKLIVTVNPKPTLSVVSRVCAVDLLSYTLTFSSNATVTASNGVVDNVAKTVSGIPTGTGVTLTATSSNSCEAILVSPNYSCACSAMNAPTSGGNQTICQGDAIPSLSATPGTGETIDWYDAITGGNLLVSTALTYTPTAAGTYYAEARNIGSNCKSARTPISLTINPVATANAGTPQSICQNNTATLAGTIGGSATSGTWTVNVLKGTIANPTSVNGAVFTPATGVTGDVTLTLTTNDPTGPCPAATSTVIVTINALPTANAGSDQTICENGNAPLVGTIGGSATTASWSVVSGGSGTFSDFNALTTTFTPAAASSGNITLRLTTAATATCTSVTDDVIITVNELPVVSAGSDAEVCANGTLTLNGSVLVNGTPTTGTWSAPSGTFSNINNLNSTYSPSITSGTVTLTLTSLDPTGPCGVITDTVVITVNPTPTLVVSNPAAVCAPATVNLTATAVTTGSSAGTLTYWEDLNASIALGTTAGVGTPGAVATTGTYYIKNTSPKGCFAIKAVNTVVNSTPSITLICGPATTSSVQFDWTNVSSATSYNYSYSITDENNNNVGTTVTGNITAPSSNFTVSGVNDGDAVAFTLTTVGLPCNATKTITCNATPCPEPVITPVANIVSCSDNPIAQINFTSIHPVTSIRWTNDNTAVGLAASGTGFSIAGSTTPTVTTKQIANITVIGTHMGCDGPVMNFTITINPKPSLSITNPAVVCAGQKVDLTAPAVTNGSMNLGPLSYYDTDGVTLLSTFNAVDVSGTYYIKSTAPGGCSDMKPVVVTINPLPTVINTVTDSRCGSGSLTLQAAANPTGTITWYDAAVNGNLLGTGNSFTTPNLTATKIYYAQAENNGCISATRTPVTATITPPVTPYVEIIADKTSVCEGTQITFKAVNPLNQGANPTYEWLVNNVSQGPATASNIFVTNVLSSTNNNDVINVKMTSSLTCVTLPTFTTPAILIKVEPVTSPGVVISASPSGPVCANDSVSFTAVPNNIGTATPSYQWYKNGVAISGATSNTYTAKPWTNNDRIYCQLTSSSACATNRVVVSNDIIMTVRPNLAAAVTIIQNPPGAFCSGTAVTFTATPINGGTTPSYQWYVNGVNAASTTATFTSATLLHNDVITVKMLSTENCISNNPATSGAIKVTVISTVIPSVSIVASANPICAGTAVTFTATPVNAGNSPLYQWYLNGTPISGQVTSQYTSTALVDNDKIRVEITNTDICGGKALSNIITMTVHPLPDATLAGGITICKNATKPILTFTGTNGIAPYTFTYTINNGPAQTITTSFGSAALLEVPTNTTGIYVYNLTSVSSSNTPSCSKNITGQQQTVIVDGIPATVVITTNTTTICPGLPITFVANTTNAGTSPTYQWLLNSNPIPGATASTYTSSTLNNNDVLNVILTSSSPCVINSPVTSPGIQIKVTPAVTPLVSISADKNNICSGTPVTFTAIPTNGGSSPLYTWKVNDKVIQSTASVTFTSSSLNQNDKVTVEMTSNQACVVNNPAISNEIIMEVTPILAMTISINASETTICYGRTVDFIATAINAGNAATYQWYIGTKKVGTDSVYFSSNTLNNGDVVTCMVTNTENCFTGNPATSNSITMKVNPVITPSVTITSDRTAICKGSCVVFRANPVNGGPNVIYQWYLNDTPIAFANSINYTSCALVDNDRIHVRITNPAPCAAPSNSNEIVISVTDLPTATITASTASVCKGETAPEVTFTGFNGVAPYTFTYTVNGVLKSVKTANTSDSVTLNVATTTSGMFNFSLISVTSGNTLACTQAQTGVASVKVEAVPFAPKATLTQPTCTTGGSIKVTNPVFDPTKPLDIYTYSIDGVDYTNTTGEFTNLAGGIYNVTYKNASGCPSLVYVVKINDDGKPVPTPKNGAICFDSVGNVVNPYIIDSNLSPLNYTFVWSSGGSVVGTQSTLTTTTVGQYSLVATSKITGCVSDVVLVDVTEAVAPFVTTAVTAEFTGNTTVTVSATPAGNYEYQLDGGSFQTSNVFTGLSAGSHTITVITGACQPVVVSVAIIDYPHYFTPNGDGINDHWNIIGLSDQPNAKIYIFDRFGKLLKQISSTSLGWDGTYNGQLLPSTDYWFTVEYTESGVNKMFKAHFSLKR